MSDSALISTAVLRIKPKAATTRYALNAKGRLTKSKVPNGLNLHSYDYEISYVKDGQNVDVPVRSPMVVYPIYSAEREAELLKAAGQASK